MSEPSRRLTGGGLVQALKEMLLLGGRAAADYQSGRSLPKIEPLEGSLQPELKTCGKPTWRCARGELHGPYLSLRWREEGRRRRRYVRSDLAGVRSGLVEWRRLHPPARSARDRLRELRRLLRELDGGW